MPVLVTVAAPPAPSLGLKAFRSLMTVHAVETTCPVVAKVSSATLAAGSPNLDHQW